MMQDILFGIVLLALTGLLYVLISRPEILSMKRHEGFSGGFKDEPEYQKQMRWLVETFGALEDRQRNYHDAIPDDMPAEQQCFVNFYGLGCRYPSYIGPADNGYIDTDLGVQSALKAGCRVFVLDIDYIADCTEAATAYFPRLVVRDKQGRLVIKESGNQPVCNTADRSNLKDVCDRLAANAFRGTMGDDPLVIVLYFQRVPPGASGSKTVLDYYSHVAKAMGALRDRMLTNELEGVYYRQKQENRLLINPISAYEGRVLVFSNANTSGFRTLSYPVEEDLDYMVHLRLGYTQTKLGVTEQEAHFGVLQTMEDFTVVPADRVEDVVEQTKQKWTVCLGQDPLASVVGAYGKVAGFGVNCVPVALFDEAAVKGGSGSIVGGFKGHGWMAKPLKLRYIKPPVVVPGIPNPSTDAKGGALRAPVVA
jgi:hypothetical protein